MTPFMKITLFVSTLAPLAVMPVGTQRAEPRRIVTFTDYAASPKTLVELWDSAQLAVLAEVVSIDSARVVVYSKPASTTTVDRDTRPINQKTVTDHNVRVLEVFKEGGPKRPSDIIRVTLRKGAAPVGDLILESRDGTIPDLVAGERVVLFVRWSDSLKGYEIEHSLGALVLQGTDVLLGSRGARLDVAKGRTRVSSDELLPSLRQLRAK